MCQRYKFFMFFCSLLKFQNENFLFLEVTFYIFLCFFKKCCIFTSNLEILYINFIRKMRQLRILYFVCFSIFFCISYSNAQSSLDSARIYKKAKSAPFWINNNPKKLAKNLTKGCNNDAEKVLAISYWICKNIHYHYTGQVSRSVEIKSNKKILKERKATSLEYSKLFKELCSQVNINAEMVHGYEKDFDYFPGDTLYRAEHVWSIVEINHDWQIIDLALAANKVEPETGLGAKIMWAVFRKPSTVKLKPTLHYNPQWICVKPEKMVLTHMPILPMFQLLEYPISVDAFQRGDSVVTEYVKRYPQKVRDYYDLEKFSKLTTTEKYVTTANEAIVENPYAHLNSAFYFYFAVDNFKNKTYLPEKDRLFAPQEELKPMLQYSIISDSLFQLSIIDDARELKAFQNRSETWKKELADNNKIHQAEIQNVLKSFTRQIQGAKKINTANTSIISYIDKNNKLYNEKKITNISRPQYQKNTDLYEGMQLIAIADSLQKRNKLLCKKYDSLIQFVPNTFCELALKNEKQALALNEKNTRILRNYVYKKGNSMPMVYFSNKAIEKKVFTENITEIEQLNKTATDTIINYLLVNQPIIFDLIKQYNTNFNLYLKTLESAKSKLKESENEDSLYTQAVYSGRIMNEKFKNGVSNSSYTLPEISEMLGTQIELLNECSKHLKRDNTLEVSRHTQYMEYRKKFRQIDTEYIKFFQKQNRDYRKYIQKALK